MRIKGNKARERALLRKKLIMGGKTKMAEKMYELIIWSEDSRTHTNLGIHTESFCRAYCKQFAGKGTIHIQCNEIKK